MLNDALIILGHIFHNGHEFLKFGVVEVSGKLENCSLEGDEVSTCVSHALDADVAIMMVHRAAGVNNQVDSIISLKQVETSLSHAHVCFATIKHYLVTSCLGPKMCHNWLFQH